MTALWEMLGVEAKFHVAYHPQSSGQVERANCTIVGMLRKYVKANGKDWDVKLPLVLMAIRSTPHRSTGVSPFEMMTGREITLPLHLLYRPEDVSIASAYATHQYVADLQAHLRATFAWAQENLEANVKDKRPIMTKRQLSVNTRLVTRSCTSTLPSLSVHLRSFLQTGLGLMRLWESIRISKPNQTPVFKWVHANQVKPYNPSPVQGGAHD